MSNIIQDSVKNLFSDSKKNYSIAIGNKLPSSVIEQVTIDYFRMMLIKNGTFDLQKFKRWAEENNSRAFYNLATNDIAYLQENGFIVSPDGNVFKFANDAVKEKLFNHQKSSLEKNTQKVARLGKASSDELYRNFYFDNQDKFQREILERGNGLEEFLTFASKLHNLDFVNTLGLYFQAKAGSIDIQMLKPHEFWENQDIGNIKIELKQNAKPFEIIVPLKEHGVIVNYAKKSYYDISQTNIDPSAIKLRRIDDSDKIYARLADSVASSKSIGRFIDAEAYQKKQSQEQIFSIADQIAKHYLFDASEQEMFRFLFQKSAGISTSFRPEQIGGKVDKKLANVIYTMNIVSDELFLEDVTSENLLETHLYEKLGQKDDHDHNLDEIQKKQISLDGEDLKDYQIGVNLSKVDLRSSVDLARQILSDEKVEIQLEYANLFMTCTKLTILSGDYAGESFVVDGDLSHNEIKSAVAREFLSKLVEKDLLKNSIRNMQRSNNESGRDKQLFGRKHPDDHGKLHDGAEGEGISADDGGRDTDEVPDSQGGESDGRDEQSADDGIHGKRSLGDREQGDRLLLSEYEPYFVNAKYGQFEHTKTHEMLNTMVLDESLDRKTFKAFSQYLSKEGIGYYSRIARAFIIKDDAFFNKYQNGNLESDHKNKTDDENETPAIVSQSGMKVNQTVHYGDKASTFLGKNIYGGDVFVDDLGVRKYVEAGSTVSRNERVYVVPGSGLERDDEESKFIKGKFELLTVEEVDEFLNEPNVMKKLDNRVLDKLKNNDLISSAASTTEVTDEQTFDNLLMNTGSMSTDENAEFFHRYIDHVNKVKHQISDALDSLISHRTFEVAHALKLGDKRNVWLKYAKYETNENGTNNIGYSVFGVEETYKPLDEFLTEIKESDAYRAYLLRDIDYEMTEADSALYNTLASAAAAGKLDEYNTRSFSINQKLVMQDKALQDKNHILASFFEKELERIDGQDTVDDKQDDRAQPDPKLIKNAEFIKKRTGLDYEVTHHQYVTFLTETKEYTFQDAGYGHVMFRAIGDKANWSVKERWLSSQLNRKHFIIKINKTLEEEQIKSVAANEITFTGTDYKDLFFYDTSYRVFDDGSIGLLKNNEVVTMAIAKDVADEIHDFMGTKNTIKYSTFSGFPVGIYKANYKLRIQSYDKLRDDIDRGVMPRNEHTLNSLNDKLQRIEEYEKENGITSQRSNNERNQSSESNGARQEDIQRAQNDTEAGADRIDREGSVSNIQGTTGDENADGRGSIDHGRKGSQRDTESVTRDDNKEAGTLPSEGLPVGQTDRYGFTFLGKNISGGDVWLNRDGLRATHSDHDPMGMRTSEQVLISGNMKPATIEEHYAKGDYKFLTAAEHEMLSADKDTGDSDKAQTPGSIGENYEGRQVFADERGARYYVEDGFRVAEPVGVTPSGPHIKTVEERYNSFATEYLTKEEFEQLNETIGKFNNDGSLRVKTGSGISTMPPAEDVRVHTIDDRGNFEDNDAGDLDDADRLMRSAMSEAVRTTLTTTTASEDENYVIEGEISQGGQKTKFKNNIAAIEVIRKLEKNEDVTKEDKAALSRYVGWGGIPQAFPKPDGSVSKGWENEVEELQSLMTDKEYEQARRSVLDSFYTNDIITRSMWKAIDRFGYKGGTVFEPAVGVGNFFGYMPKHLKPNARLIGVELDGTTAKIAQTLYPKAKIFNMGYENFSIDNDSVTLAIGNPPFGSHKIIDKDLDALNGMTIHNYFMAKTVDKLGSNGVMAMVVSNSFLDSSDSKAREYIAQSANLVGAIRLPNNAFSKNANTEVTTDIVFFQKRNTFMSSNAEEWVGIGELNDTPINNYFVQHPENLLGKWGKFGTMYRGDSPALVTEEGQDTERLLSEAIERLPRYLVVKSDKWIYSDKSQEGTFSLTLMENACRDMSVVPDTGSSAVDGVKAARINSYFVSNDQIYMRLADINNEPQSEAVTTKTNSKNEDVELTEKEILKIKGMIEIARFGNKLRAAQVDEYAAETEIEKLRKELNEAYDSFKKDFGFLNNATNKRLFEDDVNAPFLLALEKKYDKGISPAVARKNGVNAVKESAAKADIFFRRTQTPYQAPTKAENYKDALSISLSERAFVDLNYMSELLSKSVEDIEQYLSSENLIFDDPNDGWVTREEYLSGNVKQKYNETTNPKNLDALESVIPKDIEAINIGVACGAGWVPPSDVNDFIGTITDDKDAKAFYLSVNAKWSVGNIAVSDSKESVYGTGRRRAKDILLAALNNLQITVYDTIGTGSDARRVVNQDETTAANDKVDQVKDAWNDWIWETADRRERLARIYNDTFNVFAKREYDGSHLALPGKVDDSIIDMRPHQKNAVWRGLQNGRNLDDHTVGSGKTFTAIATVMELKRIGRSKKPLVAVPNHLVSQWASDWLQLYPNANILVPTKKDFTAARRKVLMSRIATGDYDAIIIAHSQLVHIQNDPEFEERFLRKQIKDVQDGIDAMRREDGQDGRTVKQFENTQEKLKAKIEELTNLDKDDNITFLELGIDALVLDEAHEFKNLQYHTSLQNVRGLGNPTGSKKAFDLYIKSQSLLEKTDNKNLLFLTGTPISNTIAEMFTVQRYLMGDQLAHDGLDHFDAWVKQFAEITTDWELSASGKYKMVTRLSKFKNMPELLGAYHTFADVVTTDMVKRQMAAEGKKLDIPAIKGGRPNNHIVERSDDQANFIGIEDDEGNYPPHSLVHRSENLPTGKPKKGDDNMLVIMSDARKASLDMRLIDPAYPDYEGSKVNKSIDDMMALYHQWSDERGTQLIFCDLSTPKTAVSKEKARIENLLAREAAGDEAAAKELEKISMDDLDALNSKFSVYDDIKAKLMQKGVPEHEIAFIHDANTDKQKEDLFAKVNGGKVRYLLGSTSKMGAGTNVQKRLVGLHHLDVPWRPSDLEQREGRIVRQGNLLYRLYDALITNDYNLELLNADSAFRDIVNELGLDAAALERSTKTAREMGGEFSVEINRYATKNTLDSGLWEKIEAKARFIEQLKNGSITDREIDDISGEAANAAEMKAAASGNPLILEEMQLKQAIRKHEAIKKSFKRSLYEREGKISYYEKQIASYKKDKEEYLEDIERFQTYQSDIEKQKRELEKTKAINKSKGIPLKDLEPVSAFQMTIDGTKYTNREEAGAAIIVRARATESDEYGAMKKNVSIGTFAGFNISVERSNMENRMLLIIEGAKEYTLGFDSRDQKPAGLSTKLMNIVADIEGQYETFLSHHRTIEDSLPKLKALTSVYEGENELQLLKQRYRAVIDTLKADDKKQNADTVQSDKPISSSIVSDWVDDDKGTPTREILDKKRISTDVLKKIDCDFTGNALVLKNELERKDYLAFEKIFEQFGGKWDRKLQAVVLSDDGASRIKDLVDLWIEHDATETLKSIADSDEHKNLNSKERAMILSEMANGPAQDYR